MATTHLIHFGVHRLFHFIERAAAGRHGAEARAFSRVSQRAGSRGQNQKGRQESRTYGKYVHHRVSGYGDSAGLLAPLSKWSALCGKLSFPKTGKLIINLCIFSNSEAVPAGLPIVKSVGLKMQSLQFNDAISTCQVVDRRCKPSSIIAKYAKVNPIYGSLLKVSAYYNASTFP
ncbi:hypothetical protein [uncultured Pluralibacter sp.]|uniref:hypothetical protein n=1 Tax=uncultured Pluralibacter sp. TaxID=1490864 RepID=UPI002609930C|nr:hypothetical protein [uncultured Pluralibacter sp.]